MKIDKEIYNKAIDYIPAFKQYERGYDCRIIVTGTFLLCMHGLMDEFNDIDILIVNAPKSFWSDFYSNNSTLEIKDYGSYKNVKVDVGGFTYNIIEDNSYNEVLNAYADCNGEIELDTLKHALFAKKNLNRVKDINHFKVITEQINSWL